MDKKTRQVLVLSHGGWKFQLDGELPQDLYNGKVFTIEKETFHRIIKGRSDLIVLISEEN
jgi:hypothetical protein